jgi:dCTP deaminase
VILTQPEIRSAVRKGEIAFTPSLEDDQWGEASIDLRIGFDFTIFKSPTGVKVSIASGLAPIGDLHCWETMTLSEFNIHSQRETYDLEPGKFVLAMTYESVKVPRNMIGRVEGRSTYARMGLSMHQTAPWIQPGWEGPIVLEIMNNGPLTIELTPKIDRPCQITFFKFSKPLPKTMTYGARTTDVYQNQSHPLRHKARKSPKR